MTDRLITQVANTLREGAAVLFDRELAPNGAAIVGKAHIDWLELGRRAEYVALWGERDPMDSSDYWEGMGN